MVEQLSIFGTGIMCGVFHNDPGTKLTNSYLWGGFFDADTQQHVCDGCRELHYKRKGKTDQAGMYSEMPMVVETERINKEFNNKKSKR